MNWRGWQGSMAWVGLNCALPWQTINHEKIRLSWLVGPLSVLLLGIALWRHGNQVLELAPDQEGWALLLFGLGATVAAQWLNAIAWWALLQWLRVPLPLPQVLLLFIRTNVYKYLPGGIWHQLGRLRWLRSQAVSGRRALLAVLLDPLLMMIAALCLVPWVDCSGDLVCLHPLHCCYCGPAG